MGESGRELRGRKGSKFFVTLVCPNSLFVVKLVSLQRTRVKQYPTPHHTQPVMEPPLSPSLPSPTPATATFPPAPSTLPPPPTTEALTLRLSLTRRLLLSLTDLHGRRRRNFVLALGSIVAQVSSFSPLSLYPSTPLPRLMIM